MLITVFLCIFKNTDQNNICAAIVFKAKTKEKYEEIFFLRFLLQNSKMLFLGGQPIFFQIFFPVLAFKIIDTQIWIRTSKIIPDLWLVELFRPIKQISTLHPSLVDIGITINSAPTYQNSQFHCICFKS